jgi:LmbE family N-acetylglucosaminyl deacetylase
MDVDLKPGLMGIFAHPDDEGSCSGSLARYALDGVRGYVVCATRGNGVDAKISDPGLATHETLGDVRSEELACACARLGIEPPIFLGYQDGEVDQVPLDEGARAVARLIRQLKPLVVVTHGPEGGYGHPDHIAVSAITTAGFDLAGDPELELDVPPFRPAKLYYTGIPRSFMEQVPGFRDRRADIRGQQLKFVGVPDDTITTAVEISQWSKVKIDALSCHRTQFEMDPETKQPKTFVTSVPEPLRSQMFGHERFVLARSKVERNGLEDDLFAGLRPFA